MRNPKYLSKIERAIERLRQCQDELTDVNMTLVGMAQGSLHTALQCLLQAEEDLGGKR